MLATHTPSTYQDAVERRGGPAPLHVAQHGHPRVEAQSLHHQLPTGREQGVFAFAARPPGPPLHRPPALGLTPHVLLQGFWGVSSQAPRASPGGTLLARECVGVQFPGGPGLQRVGGSRQVWGAPRPLRLGFSGSPGVCTPHLVSLGVRKPSRSLLPMGRGAQQEQLGTEIKGSPRSSTPTCPVSPGLLGAPHTHVLHVAGGDGLSTAVDGALGDDDDVQPGPSAPGLGQRPPRSAVRPTPALDSATTRQPSYSLPGWDGDRGTPRATVAEPVLPTANPGWGFLDTLSPWASPPPQGRGRIRGGT